MTETTPNKELLLQTLQAVKDNPEHWNQKEWHWGTFHCFAGFAELLILALPLNTDETVMNDIHIKFTLWTRDFAQEALGLQDWQASNLFCSTNTLEDLERIVDEIIAND